MRWGRRRLTWGQAPAARWPGLRRGSSSGLVTEDWRQKLYDRDCGLLLPATAHLQLIIGLSIESSGSAAAPLAHQLQHFGRNTPSNSWKHNRFRRNISNKLQLWATHGHQLVWALKPRLPELVLLPDRIMREKRQIYKKTFNTNKSSSSQYQP